MDKKLFLIDGHALIFRMYYAFLRRPMINSKGVDTSILFGFTKYLLELIDKEKPTHLAVAFDPPGGSFRNEMYGEYKANRDETPQLIIDALEPLIELCEAMRIPVIMKPGFEADDVIGTVAKKSEKEGYTTYMVTSDKDFGQLISDNIVQYRPGRSGAENEIIDKSKILEMYNIERPEQVIEVLTLWGDSSDNVPGVRGVGEVTAKKLISQYDNVKNIYNHLDELSPKQQEAFEEARSHIELSHKLVTIKTDVPIEMNFNDSQIDYKFDSKIVELFDKYEFSSLKKYIEHIEGEAVERKEIKFEVLSPSEICNKITKEGTCSIIVKTENETIFSKIKSISLGLVCPEGNFTSKGKIEEFKIILENENISKTGYELKNQYIWLKYNGIELKGFLKDVELMHYIINPEQSHKLNILSKTYLDLDVEEDGNVPEPVQTSLFDTIEKEEETKDNSKLIIATHMLGDALEKELKSFEQFKLYSDIEEPLIRVLAKMEMNGVKVDLPHLRKYASELSVELNEIEEKVRELAGEPDLNVMSPKQVGIVLYEKLKLLPKPKKKESYPTDEDTLSTVIDKHPIIENILEYRAVRKLLSTYIEPFPSYASPVTGKIHTTFNQALTATGRLSSSQPNLQNIPIRTERGREIRKAFVPSTENGLILSADYSQIELRIMAHLSCDAHMIEAFENGEDVHAMTAAKVFNINIEEVGPVERNLAKTANFGIMYGISAFGLAQRLKIPRGDAKKIIDDYFKNFTAVALYIKDLIAATKESGYVETIFGRRRYLPDINSKNGIVRSLAERNAINAPIQGSSADIIKIAMINIDKKFTEEGLKSKMVLQVHDELVFDTVPEEVEKVKEIVVQEMENVVKLSVPLTVECNYGKNWLEAH